MEGSNENWKIHILAITPLSIYRWGGGSLCLWNRQNFEWKFKLGQKWGGWGKKNGKLQWHTITKFLVYSWWGSAMVAFSNAFCRRLISSITWKHIFMGKMIWRELKWKRKEWKCTTARAYKCGFLFYCWGRTRALDCISRLGAKDPKHLKQHINQELKMVRNVMEGG